MTVRQRVAMLVAEFMGTAVLATAVINVARSQVGIGYFVAFSAAIALTTLVLTLGSTSGGHFNPAVTLGMWTLRKIQTVQALAYIGMQMLGGFAAWRLAEYFMGTTLSSIAPKAFDWKILTAEMIGTLVFTFGIAAAVYQKYEGAKLASTIGLSLFAGIITASMASGAFLNPALALANQSWDKAYVLGPIIGSVVGMNLYAMLFAPEKSLVKAAASVSSAKVVKTTRSSAKAKKPVAKKKSASKKKK